MGFEFGLSGLSEAIADQVSRMAPMLAAITIASGRHVSGIGWPPDLVITTEQELPRQDLHEIVLPGGAAVTGSLLRRQPGVRIAALRVPGMTLAVALRPASPPQVGALVVVVGATADATPTARLSAIHSVGPQGEVLLDCPPGSVIDGSLVLDGSGAVLGLCAADAEGLPTIVSYSTIVALTGSAPPGMATARGWIGAALQPVTLVRELRATTGQTRGRLVLSLTPRGPAERAGIQPGDVLLAIDGGLVNGPGTLRSLLDAGPVGRQVEIQLARDGHIATRRVVVEAHPGT
ncbi:MAG TPA: PDZ domain-containing protein [Acetobacteraceae bacterium]